MDLPTEEHLDETGQPISCKEMRRQHPILMVFRYVRDFGNQVAIIRIKWLLAGMAIFLVSVIFTQSRFNDINARARHHDKYLSSLTLYNSVSAAYNLCADGVERSDANRQQWQNLADFIAKLDSGNGKAIAFADQIRSGPVLSAAPRTLAECPVVPPKPVAP